MMAPFKSFAKEVYIRLEGDGTLVTTTKYGCFRWRTKEFRFVRRIRGTIPAQATCQVSDRAQVQGREVRKP